MLEGDREIHPEIQDTFKHPWGIPEEKIAIFCGGCDFLQPNNVCQLVGANDQGRYVEREVCGWARVSGISGSMTIEGFLPNKGIIDIKTFGK